MRHAEICRGPSIAAAVEQLERWIFCNAVLGPRKYVRELGGGMWLLVTGYRGEPAQCTKDGCYLFISRCPGLHHGEGFPSISSRGKKLQEGRKESLHPTPAPEAEEGTAEEVLEWVWLLDLDPRDSSSVYLTLHAAAPTLHHVRHLIDMEAPDELCVC